MSVYVKLQSDRLFAKVVYFQILIIKLKFLFALKAVAVLQ